MAFQEASSKVREIRDVCQGKPLQVFVCLLFSFVAVLQMPSLLRLFFAFFVHFT